MAYPYDISGEEAEQMAMAGYDPADVSGADQYYADVAGIWNPFATAYRGLQRVPGLNRIPGFRRNRPARPPMRMPQPRPPLPAAESRPLARNRGTLGMPSLTWGATDAGVLTSQLTLQNSFRAERLVIGIAVTGTPAGATRVVGQFVGSDLQSPAITSPVPVEMFAADATYAGLEWQIAFRGTQITVQMDRTAAPGTNNAVTATIGFYGQWYK